MALDVVVATTDANLTTLVAVKEELGIATSSTGSDDRLTNLIARASDWASRTVGYELRAQKYRETVAAYGSRRLMLARTPVRAVAALFYGTSTAADAIELASTEFAVEAEPGFLERLQGFEWSVPVVQELEMRPVPGDEFKPWMADYVAGYTIGGIAADSALYSTAHGTTSTGRTLPADIEEAVILRVAQRYARRDAVVARAVGDLRIQYGTRGGSGLPADPALDRLRPYIRTA